MPCVTPFDLARTAVEAAVVIRAGYRHPDRKDTRGPVDRPVRQRAAIREPRLRPPAQMPAVPDTPEAVEILDALERDRRRFLREIRVIAQLEHPGTPAAYDTGVETALDGITRLWLDIQLLRGSTLEAC
jgi:hypothetical protein